MNTIKIKYPSKISINKIKQYFKKYNLSFLFDYADDQKKDVNDMISSKPYCPDINDLYRLLTIYKPNELLIYTQGNVDLNYYKKYLECFDNINCHYKDKCPANIFKISYQNMIFDFIVLLFQEKPILFVSLTSSPMNHLFYCYVIELLLNGFYILGSYS